MKEGTKKNYEGFPAKKGTTGKYYCGRKGIVKCYCCNGACGPTNGCNCNSCKWLDDKENKTTTVKFNKAGVLAAKGMTGRYYCGKKTPTCYCCKGYCGPNKGCNCENCKELDKEEAPRKEPVKEPLNKPKTTPDYSEMVRCVICQDALRNCLYIPCKHMVTCEDCSNQYDVCPVCRSKITDKIKVYM